MANCAIYSINFPFMFYAHVFTYFLSLFSTSFTIRPAGLQALLGKLSNRHFCNITKMRKTNKPSQKKAAVPKFPEGRKTNRNISLLATESEKRSTSSSMYSDAKTRVGYHYPFLEDSNVIEKHIAMFRESTVNKRVLFVGGGNGIGILPFLCAKHGAKQVSIIDPSDVMECCDEVALENPVAASRMKFYRGSVEDVARRLRGGNTHIQDDEKFDFIFIDWVSNLLSNDAAMIEDLIIAKEHFLKESGEVMPNSAILYATALNDYEFFKSSVEWWSNVYGFRMNTMKERVGMDPVSGSVPNNAIVTSAVKVFSVTAADITRANASYSCTFSLKGIHPKVSMQFLTVYTQITYLPRSGSGFKLFSNPSDNNALIQPVSFLLPEFVPLSQDEQLTISLGVHTKAGKKGTAITLSGKYPSGKTDRSFAREYLYVSYH